MTTAPNDELQETPGPLEFGEAALAQMFEALGVKEHPMLQLPTLDQVRACLGTDEGKAELIEHLKMRNQRMALAQAEPLHWGFEMECWGEADGLLTSDECEILGIFGGNRATKSVYAIKRACQTAVMFPGSMLAMGSETEQASIATVQKVTWQFLQPMFGHLNGKRDPVFKVNHSEAGGFTDRKCVLPNRSQFIFVTYNQNPGDYEGWEFGANAFVYAQVRAALRKEGKFCPANIGAVMDESMPLSWLKMLARRLKFRKARLLWPFTPVKGITPAIKELVGTSARTVKSLPAELLPAGRKHFPDLAPGQMPYIRECVYPGAKAIYFFSMFNRFGPSPGRTYYDEIRSLCEGKESGYVERVAYGMARDSVARAFPTFGPWNMVAREHLPATGTNYFLTDPAGARNWASFWVRVGPPQWGDGNWTHYIYRDWPDAQTHGEWAVATEREVNEENRRGWDGDPGPAQAGLGYGVTKYKQVFLAAEQVSAKPVPGEDPYRTKLRAKEEGLQEIIAERYVDPRAGRSEHLAEKGGTCIIDEFAAVQVDGCWRVTGPAMELIPASGVNEEEGLTAVNELLDWNREEPLVSIVNQPHLFVSAECQQVRWMFENYTGRAGEKGACKDFADLARYMALAKLEYYAEGSVRGKRGRGF